MSINWSIYENFKYTAGLHQKCWHNCLLQNIFFPLLRFPVMNPSGFSKHFYKEWTVLVQKEWSLFIILFIYFVHYFKRSIRHERQTSANALKINVKMTLVSIFCCENEFFLNIRLIKRNYFIKQILNIYIMQYNC